MKSLLSIFLLSSLLSAFAINRVVLKDNEILDLKCDVLSSGEMVLDISTSDDPSFSTKGRYSNYSFSGVVTSAARQPPINFLPEDACKIILETYSNKSGFKILYENLFGSLRIHCIENLGVIFRNWGNGVCSL